MEGLKWAGTFGQFSKFQEVLEALDDFELSRVESNGRWG